MFKLIVNSFDKKFQKAARTEKERKGSVCGNRKSCTGVDGKPQNLVLREKVFLTFLYIFPQGAGSAKRLKSVVLFDIMVGPVLDGKLSTASYPQLTSHHRALFYAGES